MHVRHCRQNFGFRPSEGRLCFEQQEAPHGEDAFTEGRAYEALLHDSRIKEKLTKDKELKAFVQGCIVEGDITIKKIQEIAKRIDHVVKSLEQPLMPDAGGQTPPPFTTISEKTLTSSLKSPQAMIEIARDLGYIEEQQYQDLLIKHEKVQAAPGAAPTEGLATKSVPAIDARQARKMPVEALGATIEDMESELRKIDQAIPELFVQERVLAHQYRIAMLTAYQTRAKPEEVQAMQKRFAQAHEQLKLEHVRLTEQQRALRENIPRLRPILAEKAPWIQGMREHPELWKRRSKSYPTEPDPGTVAGPFSVSTGPETYREYRYAYEGEGHWSEQVQDGQVDPRLIPKKAPDYSTLVRRYDAATKLPTHLRYAHRDDIGNAQQQAWLKQNEQLTNQMRKDKGLPLSNDWGTLDGQRVDASGRLTQGEPWQIGKYPLDYTDPTLSNMVSMPELERILAGTDRTWNDFGPTQGPDGKTMYVVQKEAAEALAQDWKRLKEDWGTMNASQRPVLMERIKGVYDRYQRNIRFYEGLSYRGNVVRDDVQTFRDQVTQRKTKEKDLARRDKYGSLIERANAILDYYSQRFPLWNQMQPRLPGEKGMEQQDAELMRKQLNELYEEFRAINNGLDYVKRPGTEAMPQPSLRERETPEALATKYAKFVQRKTDAYAKDVSELKKTMKNAPIKNDFQELSKFQANSEVLFHAAMEGVNVGRAELAIRALTAEKNSIDQLLRADTLPEGRVSEFLQARLKEIKGKILTLQWLVEWGTQRQFPGGIRSAGQALDALRREIAALNTLADPRLGAELSATLREQLERRRAEIAADWMAASRQFMGTADRGGYNKMPPLVVPKEVAVPREVPPASDQPKPSVEKQSEIRLPALRSLLAELATRKVPLDPKWVDALNDPRKEEQVKEGLQYLRGIIERHWPIIVDPEILGQLVSAEKQLQEWVMKNKKKPAKQPSAWPAETKPAGRSPPKPRQVDHGILVETMNPREKRELVLDIERTLATDQLRTDAAVQKARASGGAADKVATALECLAAEKAERARWAEALKKVQDAYDQPTYLDRFSARGEAIKQMEYALRNPQKMPPASDTPEKTLEEPTQPPEPKKPREGERELQALQKNSEAAQKQLEETKGKDEKAENAARKTYLYALQKELQHLESVRQEDRTFESNLRERHVRQEIAKEERHEVGQGLDRQALLLQERLKEVLGNTQCNVYGNIEAGKYSLSVFVEGDVRVRFSLSRGANGTFSLGGVFVEDGGKFTEYNVAELKKGAPDTKHLADVTKNILSEQYEKDRQVLEKKGKAYKEILEKAQRKYPDLAKVIVASHRSLSAVEGKSPRQEIRDLDNVIRELQEVLEKSETKRQNVTEQLKSWIAELLDEKQWNATINDRKFRSAIGKAFGMPEALEGFYFRREKDPKDPKAVLIKVDLNFKNYSSRFYLGDLRLGADGKEATLLRNDHFHLGIPRIVREYQEDERKMDALKRLADAVQTQLSKEEYTVTFRDSGDALLLYIDKGKKEHSERSLGFSLHFVGDRLKFSHIHYSGKRGGSEEWMKKLDAYSTKYRQENVKVTPDFIVEIVRRMEKEGYF